MTLILLLTLVWCGIGKEEWKTVGFCERSGPSKSALYKLYKEKNDTDDDEECTIPIIVFSTLTDVKDQFALG